MEVQTSSMASKDAGLRSACPCKPMAAARPESVPIPAAAATCTCMIEKIHYLFKLRICPYESFAVKYINLPARLQVLVNLVMLTLRTIACYRCANHLLERLGCKCCNIK